MYSAFGDNETPCDDGCWNLKQLLSDPGRMRVYVCGLATDVCVKETCLDGLRLGYQLALVEDCCRSVIPDDAATARKLISKNDGLILDSDRALSMVNEGRRSLMMAYHAAKHLKSTIWPNVHRKRDYKNVPRKYIQSNIQSNRDTKFDLHNHNLKFKSKKICFWHFTFSGYYIIILFSSRESLLRSLDYSNASIYLSFLILNINKIFNI